MKFDRLLSIKFASYRAQNPSRNRLARGGLALLGSLALFSLQGCSGCAGGLNGGGVEVPTPYTTQIGDTYVNCACNILCSPVKVPDGGFPDGGFPDGGFVDPNTGTVLWCPAGFETKVCLPPNLNLATVDPDGGASDAGQALLATSSAEFKSRVADYCANVVSKWMYHAMKVSNGAWCDAVANSGGALPNADGGLGTSMVCFPLPVKPDGPATARDALNCNKPCPPTPCVFANIPDGGTPMPGQCGDDVTILQAVHDDGSKCDPTMEQCARTNLAVHPENCKCDQINDFRCDANHDPPSLDSNDVVCQAAPGMADPPTITSSPLTHLLSQPIPIKIDSNGSTADVTLDIKGQTSHRVRPLHGSVTFYGRPCPGQQCDMLADLYIFPDDFAGADRFHYDFPVPDVYFTEGSLIGGTRLAHFFADGTGIISAGQLPIDAEANVRLDGLGNHEFRHHSFVSSNPDDLHFFVDFHRGGTFSLTGLTEQAPGDPASGTAVLSVVGTVGNLPPIAVAGTYPPRECTSPQGASVTLDGSGSSDPDGDSLFFGWMLGGAFQKQMLNASKSPTATVMAPIGTTQFSLSVSDPQWTTSLDKTSVTVLDTSPPTLTLAVTPDCLWPPNHSMVLYELGNGLDAAASDVCDSSPKVEIVSVTSDQPALGGGSGNTTTDVIAGSAAFCIRAERDGTVAADRQYTITVQARDGHGNTSTKQIVVSVPHDEGGGNKCAAVDPSRIVADDDPRCSANVPPQPSHSNEALGAVATEPMQAPGTASASGCSLAGTHASSSAAVAILCAILIGLRFIRGFRRQSALLATAACAAAALAGCTNASSSGPNAATASLSQCIQGWWRNPLYDGCLCPPEPECQGTDCKAIVFRGFLANNVYYGGTVTWSAQNATMSTEGAATTGTYTVMPGSIRLVSANSDITQAVTCSGDQMTIMGTSKVRAEPGLGAALSQATATGLMWRQYPLPP